MKIKKVKTDNPLLCGFTEPVLAGYDWYSNPNVSTPDDAPTNNNSSNNGGANVIIDSIANGISSVIDSTTNFLGTWFNRGTQVVGTQEKSSISTGVLLGGAALLVVLVVFLMKKQ